MVGKNDDFVRPHHTQAIHDKYAGDKQLEIFDGDHNCARPEDLLLKIGGFFYMTL